MDKPTPANWNPFSTIGSGEDKLLLSVFAGGNDSGSMTLEASRTETVAAQAELDGSEDRDDNKERLRKFPPFLTGLNEDGRPRFTLEKIRCDGRLVIALVPSERQGVMKRYLRDDGHLIMTLIDDDDEGIDDEGPEVDENGIRRPDQENN